MKKMLALLAALLLAANTLSACTPTPDEPVTTQESDTAEAVTSDMTETPTEQPSEEETEEVTEDVRLNDGIPLNSLTLGGVDIQNYTLVVQEGGAACVRNAADELIAYIEQATVGFRIPEAASDYEIVIGVTDRDTDRVKAAREEVELDGYTILMDGNRLYITGSCDRGTMYGVYCFLEDYVGVRFLSKDSVAVIDQAAVEIPADLHTTHNPTFELRDVYWYDTRVNQTLANHSKDNSFYDNSTSVPEIGGGIGYAGTFVHTINLLQGKPHKVDEQPCLTDEAIYQQILAGVHAWLDANPDATIISVSQNDTNAGFEGCPCENCQAINQREGTPMGSLLTFVNRIADDIKDDYPGVYVDTLAYRYTRQAPKTIKPAENVIIRLCSIECCVTHALSDETCEKNVAFKKDIEEWSAICDNLYVWDYTTDFVAYFMTYPNMDVLWDNVRFFKEHNVKGLFMQGQYNSASGEFSELRSYLLSKLLWNPDMSEEEYYAHMEEFLRLYYGAGWENIKTYIDSMTKIALADSNNPHVSCFDAPLEVAPYINLEGKRDKTYNRTLLALWEEAYELAETEEQKAHVEKSSVQAYFYCLFGGAKQEREVYRDKIREICEKYGIARYNEVSDLGALDGLF